MVHPENVFYAGLEYTYEYTQWIGQRCPSDSDTVIAVNIIITYCLVKTECDVTRNHHVYCICAVSQEWTSIERPSGAPCPVGRSSHATCCLNYGEEHPQLLVTGGENNNDYILQDAWILDVNSGRWREVSGDECVTGSTD